MSRLVTRHLQTRGCSSGTRLKLNDRRSIEMLTRSFPLNFKPSRQHDPGFWRGEFSLNECEVPSEATPPGVLRALTHVRNLFSPYSGPISFLDSDTLTEISLENLVNDKLPTDLTSVRLVSETEKWSDEELKMNIMHPPTNDSNLSRKQDTLLHWVSDNFALEGAFTQPSEILATQRDPLSVMVSHLPREKKSTLQSAASFTAFLQDLEWKDVTINPDWLEEVHFALDESDSYPGELRSRLPSGEVQIVALAKAGYSFPKGAELESGVQKWCESVDKIQCGVSDGLSLAHRAQQEFVSLHPFMDSNGRLSRLVWNILLQRLGYPLAMYPRGGRHILMQAIYNTQIHGNWTWYERLCNEAVWRSCNDHLLRSEFFDVVQEE